MSTEVPQPPGIDCRRHQIFTKAVRSLHTRRNAPPPIPIRVNPMSTTFSVKPATRLTKSQQTLPWIAVELSNYPPQLTRHDVQTLFKDFSIEPDFVLPSATRFAYPLRVSVKIAGEIEAERAVKEVSGRVIGGRQIYLSMVEKESYEQKEVSVKELADELKIGIVNTARVHYPHLAPKILEVRECSQGASPFAFLQARNPITVHSELEARRQPIENRAMWDFIAGGRFDGRNSKIKDGSGRIAALKDLKETVEKQGVMKKMWNQGDGKQLLDLGIGADS
ncbi:hypothetical protein EJ02DRAFT_506176 [Clathrospora elynae]|uniref:RRM domain-containing protein n=1 Tax=Clathrospora elynae TaxID=706981 RepID=A0A6A5SIH0_9PLEO|nr:hypothetical protein EJ02DRAFT_506176 [Clathrospora elynae]